MVLIVNIITIGILSLIFILLLMGFLNNVFFSIAVLYKYTILLAPIVLFIVNLIFLYMTNSSHLWLSSLPLLIPLIYSSIIRFQNINGHKSYLKFKEFSKVIIKIAADQNINITTDDIRIRIKQRNNVSIIFNVYTISDEQKIKSHLNIFHKLIKDSFKNYNVEILIDKKKANKEKYPNIQYS